MSAFVLVSGTLFGDAERKISKLGNEFASVTIRERNGDASRWWKVTAFNDAALELLRLKDGDAVCVQGAFDASTYEKAGETRVGLSIMAERVVALRQSKGRAAKQIARKAPPVPTEPRHVDEFDDSDPF